MEQKAMIYAGANPAELQQAIAAAGGTIVANYGQSLLVQADVNTLNALQTQGFRVRVLPDRSVVQVRGFEVNTTHPASLSNADIALRSALPSGQSHQLLLLAGPMHPDWRTALERLGVTLIESVAEDHYLISVDGSQVDAVQDLPFVVTLTPYHPALKVNPLLLTQDVQSSLNTTLAMRAVDTAPPRTAPTRDAQGPIDFTRRSTPLTPAAAGTLELILFKDADQAAVTQALTNMGVPLVRAEGKVVIVAAGPGQIQALAALPQVREVNPFSPRQLHNNVATGIINADVLHNNHGLDGNGQIIGIGDSGLDTGVDDATMLADFQGRITSIFALGRPGDASDPNGHGTHVAGSVLGDGANANGNIRGTAPAANVVFQSLMDAGGGLGGIPANLGVGLFDVARNQGARIHTNSWGADVNGAYNADSNSADTFAFNNRTFLICFSAGNDAPNRIGAPGTAKNVLTIGASESLRALPASVSFPPSPAFPGGPTATGMNTQADDQNDVAAFSSIGPAQNNRRKPDVVAPGTWILSTRSSVAVYDSGPDGLGPNEVGGAGTGDEDGIATHPEAVGMGLPGQPIFRTGSVNTPAAPPGSGALATDNYMYLSGTSMATPLTAGTCALVRQYLIEQRNHTPSAALIKALMVNGAVDMGLGIPDTGQGWGRIDLTNTLFPTITNRVQFDDTLDNAVATGDVRTYDIHVSSVAEPLVVTLVWRDPPGNTIQNRLHLRVVHVATATATTADPIGDIRNNVQKVVVNPPVVGAYRIEVEGVNVATGIPELPGLRQDFAVVIANGTGFSCNPSDVVQVIDRSGSMGFYGYMEPAKERAKQMVDILQINDQTGVVSFNATAAPGVPVALTSITDQTDKDTIKNQIDLITSTGLTDLREALEDGLTTLGPDTGRPRAMVFLSDGHHTVPTPDVTNAFLATIAAANVRVYTIALGPASDAAVLNNIAAQTGTGSVYTVASAADLHRLHEIYYDILGGIGCGGVIHLNSAPAPVGNGLTEAIAVDATAREVLFSTSWEDLNAQVDLTLEAPSGQVFNSASPEVTHGAGQTYAFYRVTRPEAGIWRLHVRPRDGHQGTMQVTTAALAETEVECVAELDREFLIHGKVLLRLKAQHRDKPLTGGTAVARITFPTRSVRTLLRVHADALREIRIDRDRLNGAADNTQLAQLNILAARMGAQGQDLFGHKTIEVKLQDDGREHDPDKDDGIYTAFFDPKQAGVAGSFHIQVHFEVETPEIGRHTCTKRLPVYVPAVEEKDVSIRDIIVRRNKRWPYVILGAQVVKADGGIATPDDGVSVVMTVKQGQRSTTSDPLPYYGRGRYYIWRFVRSTLQLRKTAELTVQVLLDGNVVATQTETVKL